MAELIFWCVLLVVGISIVGAGIYWDRKPIELDHDPHADDFNKDIWEG